MSWPSQGASAPSVAEAALDFWLECKPDGYFADIDNVQSLMPKLWTYFVEGVGPAGAAIPQARVQASMDIGELFTSRGTCPPVFFKLLRPVNNRVHFLYFWKAFGEVSRMAATPPPESLTSELETFRDQVLRHIDEVDGAGSANLALLQDPESRGASLEMLVSEVHRAASMSACPRFWQTASRDLAKARTDGPFTLANVTRTLLAWLHEAVMLENSDAQSARVSSTPDMPGAGLLVLLHIYDVSKQESVQTLNSVLAHEYSPLKFGGVFHCGVEVNGLEWSYGYTSSMTRSGVTCVTPKTNPQHHYRETVVLGRTAVSQEDLASIVSDLLEEFPGPDYDLLRRNCCHFADEFCQRLDLCGIPGWIHRLARVGANIDTLLLAAQQVTEHMYGPPKYSRRPATSQRSRARRSAAAVPDPPADTNFGIWGQPFAEVQASVAAPTVGYHHPPQPRDFLLQRENACIDSHRLREF